MLAGGLGSRFWPVSTPDRPKQLLPLTSDRPLVADTVERALSLVAPDRLRVLASGPLTERIREVVPSLGEESSLVEPQARGTCPVLAWAAWEIERRDPDAVMVSLHSDHLIRPLAQFGDTVRAAVQVARSEELLVTVGAVPSRVETGYGHIQPGTPLQAPGDANAFRVEAFHEKPDAEAAALYNQQGFFWNTGIFVWKASVFLDEVRLHTPEVAEHLPLLEDGPGAFFDHVPVRLAAAMKNSTRTSFFPRNWLRLTFLSIVLGSVKSGALSPTSRAEATLAPASRTASSGPNSKRLVWCFDNLLICVSPLMQGQCPHDLRRGAFRLRPTWLTSFPQCIAPSR